MKIFVQVLIIAIFNLLSFECKYISSEDGKHYFPPPFDENFLTFFTMNTSAVTTLLEVKAVIKDKQSVLDDWDKSYTCEEGWTGISCHSTSRVYEMYG